MPQQLLYITNVGSAFEQMGGKAVSQGMHRRLLFESGLGNRLLHDYLNSSLH